MRLGVIGGTGLVEVDLPQRLEQTADGDAALLRQDDLSVDTPYGRVPLRSFSIELPDGARCELVFLQRHHNASGHGCPPHRINHRANIMAMNDANVDAVLSVCSVGCCPFLSTGKSGARSAIHRFHGC